ncbi:MAG: site-specific integrase [Clostridia bacterium]|nr:site-specific integrase [Clostridia bacterium]
MERTLKKRGNGEGTIYFSEARKKWVGQITIGRDVNGKQLRKSVYGNTRKEVKEKIDKVLGEMQSGKDINNKLSIVEIANEIRELKYNTNTIKRASYVRLGETINIMARTLPYANIPIQNVTRSLINSQSQILTEYSQSVITKVWQQLQGAFNEAQIREIVDKNPFELKGFLIKPKSCKPTKEIDALTIEEEKRFINELKKGYDKQNIIFYIAIYTGMRISEILALEKDNIDLDKRVIHIRKTLSHVDKGKILLEHTTKTYAGMRDVPIVDALYTVLLEFLQKKKKGFLFLKNGNFQHATCFNSRFQKICKNADIRVYYKKISVKTGRKTKKLYECNSKKSKVNFHMLRHTFATRCIENGVSPVVLQRILGHKDIQVTLNTYTSVFKEFKEKEIEKINNIF